MIKLSVQPDIFDSFYERHKKYIGKIGKVDQLKPTLIVNYYDVEDWDDNIAKKIIEKPDVYLENFHKSTTGVLSKSYPTSSLNIIKISIKNNPNVVKMRDIGSRHASKLITVAGIVSQVSKPELRPIEGAWECKSCGNITKKSYNPAIDKREKPTKCISEKKRKDFIFNQLLSIWIDSQEIMMQERPENIPAGVVPKPISVLLLGHLVNRLKAGDRVDLTGILRVKEPSAKQMGFEMFIEANHMEITNKEAMELKITSNEEKKIRTLAEDPNVYNLILSSIAPIYGHEAIKESLMYQMFGGVSEDRGTVRIRGDIHLLLIGDPSTSKSQLLIAVKNIMPRAMYTSGQGVTGAGLTAAVVYQGTKWTLCAGALPLSDGSIVCIDEIDKMDKDDRSTIHTAMEQQIVPIHKASIHTELNSRCGVLAAANPRMGTYEDSLSVKDNLNLPKPMLDRFDFIFILRDVPNEDDDERIALYMLGDGEGTFEPPIRVELLRKYISLARRIKPKLTKEAMSYIAKYYRSIRSKGDKDKILITPRQNEALKRVAQASARVRLSDKVTIQDAERAVKIVGKMLGLLGIDSDIREIIGTRMPKNQREKETLFREVMLKIQPCTLNELIEKIGDAMPEEDIRRIFMQLKNMTLILEPERDGNFVPDYMVCNSCECLFEKVGKSPYY